MKRTWFSFAALAAALGVAGLIGAVMTATPADAAKRKYYRAYHRAAPATVYRVGPRTRVYVNRRSWLDAGTVVAPGERKFTDYAIPPGYSFADQMDPRGGYIRQGLPDPWDLPGVRKW